MLFGDKVNLEPFYKRINEKIRETDNDTVLFFEPAVFDYAHVSMTQGPGGE